MSRYSLAFANDWLMDFGGAERCLEAMAEEFPGSPLYTLFCDLSQFRGSAVERLNRSTTFLDRPFFKNHYRRYLALYPLAVEQLHTGSPDVLLSFSHSVAHGNLRRSVTLHGCYCFTPVRYAWDLYQDYLEMAGLVKGVKSWIAKGLLHYIRLWDAGAAPRVDSWIADSRHVAKRIRRIYGREPAVIYPPVNIERFTPSSQRDDYFLYASRLVPYKRPDLAVRACTRLKLPLHVVGDGPEYKKLKSLAGPETSFLGRISDEELAREMAGARALLFPGEEDFGITPIEAQAAGTPVIAYGVGGALETVVPPEGDDFSQATGLFFREPTIEALEGTLSRFAKVGGRFIPGASRRNAERFRKERYVSEMKQFIERELEAFHGRY
ncbi:MAG: glycosyltransferase [Acidobacteriota bacterium]